MSFTSSCGPGPVRFVFMHSYHKDAKEAGEKRFLEEVVPAMRKFAGLRSIRSWKALPPIRMWTFDPYERFDRLTELLFDDMQHALAATVEQSEFWAISESGNGFAELECVFLDEQPQYDLLKDVPVQQYKYINHPGRYTAGVVVDALDLDDTFLDIYMFNYDKKFTFEEGEDWYLGHHVREGRISKRVGHKHYKTWKPLRVATPEDCCLYPNRFWRFTELGLPEYARNPALLAGPLEGGAKKLASLIYTQDPRGQVIGEWRNILIDPKDCEDLTR